MRKIEHRKDMGTGRETQTAFDADGLDTATYWVKDGERFLLSRKKRDAFGRIIAEGDSLNAMRRKVAYNDLGYETGDTVWSSTGVPLIFKKYLDATGRDTAQLLANGDSVHYRIDGFGNKLATRNFVKVGNLRVQTTADSNVYDLNNQPLVRYDSLSLGNWKKTTFLYDMQGNLKRSVGSRNETTLYGYSEAGKPLWSRDAVGKWMWYVYDERGFDSLTVTLAKGHEPDTNAGVYTLQTGDWVHATRQDNAGNLRQVREGFWQASYSKAEDLSLVRAMGYYPSNRVQTDSIPVDINNQQWLVTQYEWFPTGELKKATRTGGMVSEYVYNEKGQKIAELAINTQGGMDTTKAWTFDEAGRLVEERTPGLGGVIRTYDEANRVISVIDSSGVRTGLKLDALGRVVADTNGLGYVAKHAYGPNADTLRDRKHTATYITRDPFGRVIRIEYGGSLTTYHYEEKEDGTQRDSVAYPDGTWEVTVTDKGGRQIQKLDKRGVTANYTYNSQWQLESIDYGSGTSVAYEYDSMGRNKAVTRVDGSHTMKSEWTFDNAGRPLTSTQITDGVATTLTYSYNDLNRIVTLTLPEGKTIVKRMDIRNRLDSVAYNGSMDASYQYALNALDTATLGNGVGIKWQNTAAGRALSETYKLNGNALHAYEVGYDYAGFVKTITRGSEVEKMSYDKEGQLTGWRRGSDTTAWTLDSRGNWISLWKNGSVVDVRTFNGANTIATRSVNGTAQTVAQDDLGQLTQLGSDVYTWSNDQRLNGINGSTVVLYDGLGRMVKQTSGASSTDYLYDNWSVVRETRMSSNSASTIDFAYGPTYVDELVSMHVVDGNGYHVYWLIRDNNMNVVGATDLAGAVVERYEIGAYGDVKVFDGQGNSIGVSSIGNSRFFQGLEKVGDNYSNRNRWLNVDLGRFTSRDPLGPIDGDADNTYRALLNNPSTFVDPTGELAAVPYIPAAAEACAVGLGVTAMAASQVNECQKQTEYEAYKARCNEPPPPGLTDPCELLKWKLNRNEDCRDMRQQWDDKWAPGRHTNDISNLDRAIENLKKQIEKVCNACKK